jgi:hypothetical protein
MTPTKHRWFTLRQSKKMRRANGKLIAALANYIRAFNFPKMEQQAWLALRDPKVEIDVHDLDMWNTAFALLRGLSQCIDEYVGYEDLTHELQDRGIALWNELAADDPEGESEDDDEPPPSSALECKPKQRERDDDRR